MREVKYKDDKYVIEKTNYGNGNLALILVMKEYEDRRKSITVTKDIHEKLEKDQAYVTDFSENKGILRALKEAGLIKKVISSKTIGFVCNTLVEFNMNGIEEHIR